MESGGIGRKIVVISTMTIVGIMGPVLLAIILIAIDTFTTYDVMYDHFTRFIWGIGILIYFSMMYFPISFGYAVILTLLFYKLRINLSFVIWTLLTGGILLGFWLAILIFLRLQGWTTKLYIPELLLCLWLFGILPATLIGYRLCYNYRG